MSTPEELLCSRKWRLTQGTWMLWAWLSAGFLAWVGYLIIGLKAKNWRWILLSAAFFAWGIGFVVLVAFYPQLPDDWQKGDPTPPGYDNSVVGWSMLYWFVGWIGNAAGLQWFVNRKWLVWRAHNNAKSATPWYATATATPGAADGASIPAVPVSAVAAMDNALRAPAPARVPAAAPPATATATPLLTPPAPATPQAPSRLAPPAPGTLYAPGTVAATPALIDLNTATRDQLAALPGIDLAWADHIIATRERIGRFANPTDLVTAASLQPHVFAGIRDRLVATPPAVPEPAVPADGRRLEF